jgi:putative membrane protein
MTPEESSSSPPPLNPQPDQDHASEPPRTTGQAGALPEVHGRLHLLTLPFTTLSLASGVAIPALLLLVVGGKAFVAGLMLVFLVIPLTMAVAHYFAFSYRIEAGELITREGILSRTERHIPLTRVQDIRLEQGVLHRWFRVTNVQVETAGGEGAEASLSVLSQAEAERLRKAVFERKSAAAGLTRSQIAESPPAPREDIVRRLSMHELVLAGVTSNYAASVIAIVFVLWGQLDNLLPQETYERYAEFLASRLEQTLSQAGWLMIFLGGLAIFMVGLLISIFGSILLFHGFTLSRRGEDLHRTYGLFTRRASSLPRRRIQLVRTDETFLRRLFKLATLRADTAGGRSPDSPDQGGGRDVLLPIVPHAEVENLLTVFFPDLDPGETHWRNVSRRAIRRGTFKGGVACGVLAVMTSLLETNFGVLQNIYNLSHLKGTLYSLFPLVFLPLIYWVNVMSYRHLGYVLGERFLRTRRGWLSRTTHVVPIRSIQSVVLHQNPFDRRHGVRTLTVDTAGQTYTGGGPKIHNLPAREAELVARILTVKAAQTQFKW